MFLPPAAPPPSYAPSGTRSLPHTWAASLTIPGGTSSPLPRPLSAAHSGSGGGGWWSASDRIPRPVVPQSLAAAVSAPWDDGALPLPGPATGWGDPGGQMQQFESWSADARVPPALRGARNPGQRVGFAQRSREEADVEGHRSKVPRSDSGPVHGSIRPMVPPLGLPHHSLDDSTWGGERFDFATDAVPASMPQLDLHSLGSGLGPSLGSGLGPSLGSGLGPSLGSGLGVSLGSGLKTEPASAMETGSHGNTVPHVSPMQWQSGTSAEAAYRVIASGGYGGAMASVPAPRGVVQLDPSDLQPMQSDGCLRLGESSGFSVGRSEVLRGAPSMQPTLHRQSGAGGGPWRPPPTRLRTRGSEERSPNIRDVCQDSASGGGERHDSPAADAFAAWSREPPDS